MTRYFLLFSIEIRYKTSFKPSIVCILLKKSCRNTQRYIFWVIAPLASPHCSEMLWRFVTDWLSDGSVIVSSTGWSELWQVGGQAGDQAGRTLNRQGDRHADC